MALMAIEKEIFGTRFRIEDDGSVSTYELCSTGYNRPRQREWQTMTNSTLLAYSPKSEFWVWLRENGIRRPSPSGPRGPETRTEADRGGARVRLDEAATSDADTLAKRWGVSRPEAIARALREIAHR